MKIQIGDKVAYSANFLRSIGAITGDMGFARGVVEGIISMSGGKVEIATIKWNKGDFPLKVNVKNLAKVGTMAMNAN